MDIPRTAALHRHSRSTPSRRRRVSIPEAEGAAGEDEVHRGAAVGAEVNNNSRSLLPRFRESGGESYALVQLKSVKAPRNWPSSRHSLLSTHIGDNWMARSFNLARGPGLRLRRCRFRLLLEGEGGHVVYCDMFYRHLAQTGGVSGGADVAYIQTGCGMAYTGGVTSSLIRLWT